MSEGQADRLILFKLKVIPDDTSPTALKKFAADIKAAYRDAYRGGAAEAAKAQVEAARAQNRGGGAGGGPDLDAIRRRARGESAGAARDAEKAVIAKMRLDERMAADRERLQQREVTAHDRGVAKMTQANIRMTSSLMRLGDGLMGAARGFALLGVAGEKDSEKMLEGFLKVQGAFDIVHAVGNVGNVSRRALLAANRQISEAAKTGVKAPLLARGVAGAGNLVGAMLPYAPAAAALVGGMAWGKTVAGRYDPTSGPVPDSWAARSIMGLNTWGVKELGIGKDSDGGVWKNLADASERTERAKARQASYQAANPMLKWQTASFGIDTQEATWSAGQRGGRGPIKPADGEDRASFERRAGIWQLQSQLAQTSASRLAAEGRQTGVQGELDALAKSRQSAPNQDPATTWEREDRLKGVAEEVLALRAKELGLARQIGDARLASVRAERLEVEAIGLAMQAQRASLRESQRGQAISFGMADPGEQAQRIQIQRQLKAGGAAGLPAEWLRTGMQDADPRTRKIIEAEAQRRHQAAFGAAGLDPDVGWSAERRQTEFNEKEARGEKFRVTAIGEVDLKLEMDTRQIEDALEGKFNDQRKLILDLIRTIGQRNANKEARDLAPKDQ